MSGYYLCRTECAVRPFYIESIGRNIYSLEELCYYFSHYVYLIDESVVNVTLCRWIGTELGLVKLQNRLLRALERETYTEFLSPIFQECGYLDKQEFRLFQEQFTEILTEPEEVRRKMKISRNGNGTWEKELTCFFDIIQPPFQFLIQLLPVWHLTDEGHLPAPECAHPPGNSHWCGHIPGIRQGYQQHVFPSGQHQ